MQDGLEYIVWVLEKGKNKVVNRRTKLDEQVYYFVCNLIKYKTSNVNNTNEYGLSLMDFLKRLKVRFAFFFPQKE